MDFITSNFLFLHILSDYFSFFVFAFLTFILGFILFFISYIVYPSDPYFEKISVYECGFEPFEDTRIKFDIKFYLVSILFIIFDMEIVFLFPWSLIAFNLGFFGFLVILVFLIILFLGFFYEWWVGALDWE